VEKPTIKEEENISRKEKRFYRRNAKLFDKIKSQILQAKGLKEREKQKILMRLRFQLEELKEKEGIEMSSAIYNQMKKQGTDIGEMASKEAKRTRDRGKRKKFSEDDLNLIADNIYNQLVEDRKRFGRQRLRHKEPKEISGRKFVSWRERRGIPPLNETSESEVEKIKKNLAEKLSEKEDIFENELASDIAGIKDLEVEDILGEKKPKKKKRKKEEFDLEGFDTESI